MRKRYLCPKHQEDTPSAVLYGDRYYCFGCHVTGPAEELGESVHTSYEESEPENLSEKFQYINSLERRSVRGLSFPADSRGYYISWPDASYYKLRFFTGTLSKYIGPTGHKKSLFKAHESTNRLLCVVEGEINSLSIALTNPPFSVYSPGSSGDFYGKNLQRYLQDYTKFDRLVLIADKDAAGAQACISLKAELIARGKVNVKIVLWNEDANEILVTSGKEKLIEKLASDMEVPRWLCADESPL